jgi:hypothetical protein
MELWESISKYQSGINICSQSPQISHKQKMKNRCGNVSLITCGELFQQRMGEVLHDMPVAQANGAVGRCLSALSHLSHLSDLTHGGETWGMGISIDLYLNKL